MGKPYENWFEWLENKLSTSDFQCFVPHFPTPSQQSYENWEKLLNFYCDLGFINRDTIFIAHSLGPVFIAKYVIENDLTIKGLITVSGFNNFISGMEEFDNMNKSFFIDNFQLSKLKDHMNYIHSFISDDDPNLPSEKTLEFAQTIGGEIHLIPNGGHFNETAGYTEFIELWEIIRGFESI